MSEDGHPIPTEAILTELERTLARASHGRSDASCASAARVASRVERSESPCEGAV